MSGTVGTRGIFADFENQGTVIMDHPLSIDGGSVHNAPGGVFEGNGALTLVGTTLVNGGVLSPGVLPDTGQLAVFNDFTQEPSGAFTVQLGGVTPDAEHDQMTVVGSAILDGTLNIELLDGFAPVYGDSFVIVNHGSRMGEFAAITGVDIGDGLLFNIAYRDDYVVLAAGDFLPPSTHVIVASAGQGGSISPVGNVYVPDMGDVTFAISPDPGYGVGDVLVDGESVGAAALYGFVDVTTDHTIEAYFTPADFEYEPLDIGADTDMNGIYWGNHDFGVVVGDGGEIRITDDGGLTWWAAEHGVQSDLYDVRVLGDLIIVVGADGTVCISEDGGITWYLSPSDTGEILYGLEVVHDGLAYAVGANGTVICWDGSGWIPVAIPGLPVDAELRDIIVVYGIVYIVGSNGLVVRHDGPGSDWVILWDGQDFDFRGVSFHSANNGYAVGTGGNVWYTDDGGVTWLPSDVGYAGVLRDCLHVSGSTVWIIGDDGRFIRTTDGGLSWSNVQFPRGDAFYGIANAGCRGNITGLLGETYAYETAGCVEEPGGLRGLVRLDGTGTPGVTVRLLDEAGQEGVLDADGLPVGDLSTDAGGQFVFPNLVPEIYIVEVVPPAGTSTPDKRRQVLVRAGSDAVVTFDLETQTSAPDRDLPVVLACSVYPNPFNPATTVHFDLPTRTTVHVDMYDPIIFTV